VAFYNPSITASDAVVLQYSSTAELNRKQQTVASASECLKIDSHFGISQEH